MVFSPSLNVKIKLFQVFDTQFNLQQLFTFFMNVTIRFITRFETRPWYKMITNQYCNPVSQQAASLFHCAYESHEATHNL